MSAVVFLQLILLSTAGLVIISANAPPSGLSYLLVCLYMGAGESMHGNDTQPHSNAASQQYMAHAPRTADHTRAVIVADVTKSLPVGISKHHCCRCTACSQEPREMSCGQGGLAPGATTGSGGLLVQQPGDTSKTIRPVTPALPYVIR